MEKVNRQLLELKKTCEKYEILENPGAVSLGMLQVMGELDKFLEEPPNEEVVDEILDFYFCVRDFLNIDELVDENYVVYTENGEDGKFWMKLFCVNPAANLGAFLERESAPCFFLLLCFP